MAANQAFKEQHPDRYSAALTVGVHSAFERLMKPYMAKRGNRIDLHGLADAVSLKIWGLPQLALHNGRDGTMKTCQSYALGHCNNRFCGMAHAAPSEMDEAFVTNMTNVLGPAITSETEKPYEPRERHGKKS